MVAMSPLAGSLTQLLAAQKKLRTAPVFSSWLLEFWQSHAVTCSLDETANRAQQRSVSLL
jgi:hypothetical protein